MIANTINDDKTIADGGNVIIAGWNCGLVAHHDHSNKFIWAGEVRYESY